MTSKGRKMKSKKMSLFSAVKAIVFNEVGGIGDVLDAAGEAADAREAAAASEESSEEVSEEPVEEAIEASEEVSEEVSEESTEEVTEESEEEVIEVKAESEEELEEEIEEAIEKGASEEEVKSMIRQFTLKVDGKEFTRELDLDDDEAIKAELQKAYKGQKTMQEKAEQEKLFGDFLEGVKADPFKMMKMLDPDFDPVDYSSRYFDELLKEQELSPEERESIQKQKEFEETKAELDKMKKEANEKRQKEEDAKLVAEIKTDIMSALDEDPELVADDETVAMVAGHLHWAASKGIDISAKEVLPTVKDEIKAQFQKAAGRLRSPDLLKKYMGDNLLEKLRQDRVQTQQKKVTSVNDVQSTSKTEVKKPEEKEKIKLSDWMR